MTTYQLTDSEYEVDVRDFISKTAYRIHLVVSENEEGGFSATALNLPGAGSSGPTEAEAIERAKEAAEGVIEEYRRAGEEIPIESNTKVPQGGKSRWITVYA